MPNPRAILVGIAASHVDRRRGGIALVLQPALSEGVLVRVWREADGLRAENPAVAARVGRAFGATVGCCLDVLALVEAPVPCPSAVVIGV